MPPSTGGDHRGVPPLDVPAAGGLPTKTNQLSFDLCPGIPETRDDTTPTTAASPTVDDSAMEDLLREILAPSPSQPSTSLPMDPHTILQQITSTSSMAPATPTMTNVDWASEAEMQIILNMLPSVHSDVIDVDNVGYPSALDLELRGGWEFEHLSGSLNGIGVF